MPERFLILGASSFYGRNFAKLVEERGDISKPAPINWALGAALPDGYDYIVNFASASLVAESWDDERGYFITNTSNTIHTVKYLIGTQIKKFVHVSTPESYGHTPSWVDESHTDWRPSTPYAVSRAAADMMLKAYHKAKGFPAVITRTANIYGPGQQDFRIIPKAIAHKRRNEILPLHGKGESVRSFIHIKDACEATYLIAKSGKVGETYHISTPKAHSIREVVEMIGCKYEFVPDRLGKDQAYLLNSRKVRNLGWKDTISLEEGLKECESQT